jgi:PAS domain S-box-containing protein
VFAELHRKTRELGMANRALLAEIAERKHAQDELCQFTCELEQRVAERTATLAKANAALVDSDERLQLAQSAGGVGVWDWNIVTDDTFWSEAMWSIYGIEPIASSQIQQRWRSLLHPDDRERIIDRLAATLTSADNLFRCEFRVVTPDGTTRWVESIARATRDDRGAPVRMSGVNVDVTERKRAADRLRLSEERFQLALKNSRILVYTTDRDLRYTWTSGPYPAFMPEQVLGRRDEELFSPQQASPLVALKQRVLNSGVGEHGGFAIEIDGINHQYDLTVEPLCDASGELVGLTVAAMEITDLKQAEAALKDADRRKDEFLATLAHELRNPLAPIRTAVEILRLKGPDTPELQWARGIIDRQTQQMTRLVDDLLDVSRITTGKLTLQKEQVELETIVQSAVETSRPLIEQCRHELRIALPAQPIALSGDPTRLAQVLSNLLNNAAKYTEPGGCIELTAQRQDTELMMSVRDTGMGITSEMLPFVFELFTQGDRHLERSQGGLGVGLTLVKRLVELHGGSIEARSGGSGKGSEFIVRLPLAVEHRPVILDSGDNSQIAVKKKLRILIVDDNKDNADCLSIMLKIMGHHTRTAHDGLAAIEAAAEFRPEVVLLDIGMPKLNGYGVCAHIREQPWGKNMVLIAQTGWGQDDDRRRTQAAGFEHHLIKPVKHDALMKLLAEL